MPFLGPFWPYPSDKNNTKVALHPAQKVGDVGQPFSQAKVVLTFDLSNFQVCFVTLQNEYKLHLSIKVLPIGIGCKIIQ
jgi:hypothetical protein